ncbi:hypothetical protein OUZ56_029926 [Daphnia magna]|uniref:Recombinase zinc beta ribbon domain-containing protein n=1 Tax=Daphnia magna TaxID=35525 RepID=A0ABR0B8A2_9CRUS|nr:hypothetical protein OUZ56_029926 [Daphnia magna]
MGRRQNLAAAHPHRELITDGPYSISVDAIKRLVSDGILPHRNCSLCNQTMALHQSTGYVDGCYWKCTYRNPKNKRPCKGSTSSVRTGTLYERSRLSIPELSYSQMKEKMKIANNETIGRRTKYLREVVFHLVFGLSAQFTQIGGVGKTVEIDESLQISTRELQKRRVGVWWCGTWDESLLPGDSARPETKNVACHHQAIHRAWHNYYFGRMEGIQVSWFIPIL